MGRRSGCHEGRICALAAGLVVVLIGVAGCGEDMDPPPGACFDDKDCKAFQACAFGPSSEPPVGTFPATADANAELDANQIKSNDASENSDADVDASWTPLRGYGRCACRSDRCGGHEACTSESAGGSCISVQCSRPNDCPPGHSCLNGSCYDLAGVCSSADTCRVPSDLRSRLEISCSSTCRSAVKLAADVRWPSPLIVSDEARLLRPHPYESVPDVEALSFEWTPPPSDGWSLLIVTDRIVSSSTEVDKVAKWYAYLPNSSANARSLSAVWSDGTSANVAVVSEKDILPFGIYYATALHIRLGVPISASPQVPFRVGPWPRMGEICDRAIDRFTQCDRPDRPQACFDGQCRVICVSHDDCADHLGISGLCSLPDEHGLRFCPTE